jgi:hypothetical protein
MVHKKELRGKITVSNPHAALATPGNVCKPQTHPPTHNPALHGTGTHTQRQRKNFTTKAPKAHKGKKETD